MMSVQKDDDLKNKGSTKPSKGSPAGLKTQKILEENKEQNEIKKKIHNTRIGGDEEIQGNHLMSNKENQIRRPQVDMQIDYETGKKTREEIRNKNEMLQNEAEEIKKSKKTIENHDNENRRSIRSPGRGNDEKGVEEDLNRARLITNKNAQTENTQNKKEKQKTSGENDGGSCINLQSADRKERGNKGEIAHKSLDRRPEREYDTSKKCFNCNAQGQIAKQCQMNNQNSLQQNDRNCFNCGKFGHMARNCWYRHENESYWKPRVSKAEGGRFPQNAVAKNIKRLVQVIEEVQQNLNQLKTN